MKGIYLTVTEPLWRIFLLLVKSCSLSKRLQHSPDIITPHPSVLPCTAVAAQGIFHIPHEIFILGTSPQGYHWGDSVTLRVCWEVGESCLLTSGDISGGQVRNNNSSVATGGEGFVLP